MSIMLDYIGALVLIGLLMLTIVQMNASFMEDNAQNNFRVSTQETVFGTEDSLAGVAEVITAEFSKIGYGVTTPPAITTADTNRISFSANLDGTLDAVSYFVKPRTVTAGKGNPNLVYALYRHFNTKTDTAYGLPVSSFKMTYLDSLGRNMTTPVSGTTNLSAIRSIRIQMMVEADARIQISTLGDTTFGATYWDRLISPKNIQSSM
jgi:hypothetical protein